MTAIDWLLEPWVFAGWAAGGLRGLTDDLVRARLDAYVAAAMARV
jgi:hypothetical protein